MLAVLLAPTAVALPLQFTTVTYCHLSKSVHIVSLYTHIYICVCVCVYMCLAKFTHVHISICMCMCMYTYIYVCICCVCLCTSVRTYARTYVCMYVYIQNVFILVSRLFLRRIRFYQTSRRVWAPPGAHNYVETTACWALVRSVGPLVCYFRSAGRSHRKRPVM